MIGSKPDAVEQFSLRPVFCPILQGRDPLGDENTGAPAA